jgi:hypothetical protein
MTKINNIGDRESPCRSLWQCMMDWPGTSLNKIYVDEVHGSPLRVCLA